MAKRKIKINPLKLKRDIVNLLVNKYKNEELSDRSVARLASIFLKSNIVKQIKDKLSHERNKIIGSGKKKQK